MTDHDAALRFDTALDQLVRGEAHAADGLLETARSVHELGARQHAAPSEAFRVRLRGALTGEVQAGVAPVVHLNGNHPVPELVLTAPMPARPSSVRPAHRWLAIAAALLLLLAGGGAIVLEGFGFRDDPEPSAIPAAAFASPTDDVMTATVGQDAATPQPANNQVTTPVALADGTIYRIMHYGGFTGLRAYRAGDQQQLWEVPTRSIGELLAADEQGAYVSLHGGDAGDEVIAFNADGGLSPRWRWTSGGVVTGLVVDRGVVSVVDSTGAMTALDAATGDARWERRIDDGTNALSPMWSSMTVGVSAPYLVALTGAGTFAILNQNDGTLVWSMDGYDPAGTTFAVGASTVALFERRMFAPPESESASPEASAEESSASERTSWQVTSYDVSNGQNLGSRTIRALTGDPIAIGDVVAIPGAAIDSRSGPKTGLLAIAGRGGSIIAPELPTWLAGETIARLGTWIPPDSRSELFVVVTAEGLLLLVSPQRMVAGGDPVSPYDGAAAELGQPVVGEIAGGTQGIAVTLADQRLLGIPPDQLLNSSMDSTPPAAATPASDAAWIVDGPIGTTDNWEVGHAIVAGRVIRAWGTGTGWTQLQAIDAVNGRVDWEEPVSVGGEVMYSSDDLLFLAGRDYTTLDDDGVVVALDAATGDELWRAPLSDQPVATTIVGNRLLVLGATNYLDSVDLETGTVLYSADIGGESDANYPNSILNTSQQDGRLAVAGDTLFASLMDGSVVAVDIESGEGLWWVLRPKPGQVQVFALDGAVVTVDAGDLDAIDARHQAGAQDARDGTPTALDFLPVASCSSAGEPATPAASPVASPVRDSSGWTPSMVLTGFDSATSSVLWTSPSIEGAGGAVVTDAGLTYLVIAGDGSRKVTEFTLCAIDPRTGHARQIERASEISAQVVRLTRGDESGESSVVAVLDDGRFVPVPAGDQSSIPLVVQADESLFADSWYWSQFYDGAFYFSLQDGRLVKVMVAAN